MNLSQKSLVDASLFFLLVKMTISPLATGDYEIAAFKSINYVCDVGILLSVLFSIKYTFRKFQFIYNIFFVLAVTYVLATISFTDESVFSAISYHLKVYLPLLLFTMLASYFHQNSQQAISYCKFFLSYTISLLAFGLIILPDSMNRLEVWWPSYFGGLHTTAYMAMSVFFLSYALYKARSLSSRFLLIIGIVTLYCVFFGWGVRTVTGAFFIFIFSIALMNYQLGQRKLIIVFLPILLILFIFIVFFIVGTDSFNQLTSGRISMYSEKVDQLLGNNALNWMIGNGFGSDLIETEVWWWAAKGAHSDLITFLVEGGLIYLSLTIYNIYKLFFLFKGDNARFLLLGFTFTSMFSNGYLVRPISAYLFFVSLALCFASYKRDPKIEK